MSGEPKLRNFRAFFEALTERQFPVSGHCLAFPGFVPLGFALVGIDSTLPCTFLEEDNYGLVLEETVKQSSNALKAILSSDSQAIRVAILHHCPNPYADENPHGSYLQNARDVRRYLAIGDFQLSLCGHEHQQGAHSDLRTGHQVFCTGSYGLDAAALHQRYIGDSSRTSNRYEMLLLHDDRLTIRCMLRKLEQPGGLDARWTRDDDYGPDEFPVMPREPYVSDGKDPREIAVNFGNPVPHPHRPDVFIFSVALAGPEDAMRELRAVEYLTPDGPVKRYSLHESFRAELALPVGMKSMQVEFVRRSSPNTPVLVSVSVPWSMPVRPSPQ
jgi:hypothetical protein